MSFFSRLWLAALCVLSILAAGCAPPPRATVPVSTDSTAPREPASTPAESRYGLEDEGDEVPLDDVVFEEDALEAPEDVGGESFADEAVVGESIRVEPSVRTPVAASDPNAALNYEERRGFRVQIGAVSNREEAERLGREAKGRLLTESYVELEHPFFKVRVGDFLDRAAALGLRDRAKQNGYGEAWVVTTQIRVAIRP